MLKRTLLTFKSRFVVTKEFMWQEEAETNNDDLFTYLRPDLPKLTVGVLGMYTYTVSRLLSHLDTSGPLTTRVDACTSCVLVPQSHCQVHFLLYCARLEETGCTRPTRLYIYGYFSLTSNHYQLRFAHIASVVTIPS